MSRVPFGIAGPGIEPGSHTRTMVSGVDILPTILDYAGQARPSSVHGRSLRPLVEGGTRPVEPVLSPNAITVLEDRYLLRDDDGRVMVLINWNSDMGDGWEHTYHPSYPTKYANLAYQLGINYLIYAMTH